MPKLQGLVTEGDSFEKAMKMVRDAITGYVQILQEKSEEIPKPDDRTITPDLGHL